MCKIWKKGGDIMNVCRDRCVCPGARVGNHPSDDRDPNRLCKNVILRSLWPINDVGDNLM